MLMIISFLFLLTAAAGKVREKKKEMGTNLSGTLLSSDLVHLQPPPESHGGCQVNGPKVAKFLDR